MTADELKGDDENHYPWGESMRSGPDKRDGEESGRKKHGLKFWIFLFCLALFLVPLMLNGPAVLDDRPDDSHPLASKQNDADIGPPALGRALSRDSGTSNTPSHGQQGSESWGHEPPLYVRQALSRDIIDADLWNDIRESKSASDFEMYLRAFPDGLHASEARAAANDPTNNTPGRVSIFGDDASATPQKSVKAEFASIDDARKQLPLGPVAFNVPTPVDIDNDCPCRIDVIVSAIDDDPKKLEGAIKSENPAAKNFQTAKIRISPHMVASLSASPDDFDVNPKGDQERLVGFGEPANWTWTIVPKSWGPHVLTLAIKANVMIAGKAEAVSVKTFTRPLLVAVTPFGRAKHFVENHLEFAWGSLLLPFFGFLAWLWKRSHAKVEPKPRNPRRRP